MTGKNLLPAATGTEASAPGAVSVQGEAVCLYRNTGINRISRDWDPPLNGSMIFDGRYKLSL